VSKLIVLNLITYLITLLEPDSEDDKMAMSEDRLVEGMFHNFFFAQY
jgi:hypothetical protein